MSYGANQTNLFMTIERMTMRSDTNKDKVIAKKLARENRALSKVAARIRADDGAYGGAIAAGLMPDDYPVMDMDSLKSFILEAKQVAIVTAPIDTDQGRDQVINELRKWR